MLEQVRDLSVDLERVFLVQQIRVEPLTVHTNMVLQTTTHIHRRDPRPPVPDTGSLIGDLSALACQLASQLRSARWPAVLPSIIDAAEPFAESVV